MKHIGQIVAYLLLGINAFLVGMLILSAYSPHLSPHVHPYASLLGLAFPIFLTANLLFTFFWLFVRIRYVLLSLAGLLLCAPQIRTYIPFNSTTKEVPEESIRVLSYNVMNFGNLEKSNGENHILNYLARSGADIICLQEYHTSTQQRFVTEQDVNKALKAYPYRSVSPRSSKRESQLACFSKFPILSARRIEYRSDFNGSMKYLLKVGKDTVLIINNHLESNKLTKADRGVYEDMVSDPNAKKVKKGARRLIGKLAEASALRAAQADSVAKVIATSPYPTTIVCGDFNDSSISYTHRILTKQLDDAFTKAGRGLGISYNQNKFYFRIDNILISPNLRAYNCIVDHSIKASDHYPIRCHISKR